MFDHRGRPRNQNMCSSYHDTINKVTAYYSTWQWLKRAVAWFLRLKTILMLLKNKRKELEVSQSENNRETQNKLVGQNMKKFKSR